MNHEIVEQTVAFLNVGGPVVWVHVLMSILLVTLLLMKLWQFSAGGLFSPFARARADRAVGLWESGDADAAIDEIGRGKDAQSRILAQSARHMKDGSLRGQALIDEIGREAAKVLGQLRSQLRSIELIASLAPLLGLLGTVLGMIEAFQAMEAAGRQVDPGTLSGGIWKALLTTAVGLIVAVPAIVTHNWLERRIERFNAGLNDRFGRMLTAARLAPADGHDAQPLELHRARA